MSESSGGMFHGMHGDFMAHRSESSVGGSQFNILQDNFYSAIPLDPNELPPMNPQSLYSHGS